MRQYSLVSGAFFTLLTCLQILRLLFQWPVTVSSMQVPVWLSGIAAIIVGSLAVWAFRVAKQKSSVVAS